MLRVSTPLSGRVRWERVICVASGPSLDAEQAAKVSVARSAGWRVVVVNDCWRLVPSAEILYACDARWWRVHIDDVKARFAGERWTQVRRRTPADIREAERFGLFYVRSEPGSGLLSDPETISTGGNSGHQAIQLAVKFGAEAIVLVGYDMQNTGGRAHWFGDHQKPLGQAANPSTWVQNFDHLARDLVAAGITVVNATRETALRCFARLPLDEALASITVGAWQ